MINGQWSIAAAMCLGMLLIGNAEPARAASPSPAIRSDDAYQAEEIHDSFAGRDEAVTNLRIANHRWPDCYSNESAIRDIFRLEGVADKGGQEQALALWKWFRLLVSSTCGGYCYETDAAGAEEIVYDPHKIFTVYGHHMCDGLSWAFVPLWRASGQIAFDECHFGHTIASLRYRDTDGQWRFHDLDPQSRFYYWDEERGIIGTWTMPLLRARVHRHLTAPQRVHTLRTSLRPGEQLELLWDNEGHVIQAGRPPKTIIPSKEYAYTPGRKDDVYAACGQATQTFVTDLSPERFPEGLGEGWINLACSAPGEGRATLHPAETGKPAVAVVSLPSAFVAVDGQLQATLVRKDERDLCRLSLSRDGGKAWKTIHEMQKLGREEVNIDLGRPARAHDQPHVYTAYDFLVRAEFQTAGQPEQVGLCALRVTAFRQTNKRTLPNLMPGENVFRVTADRLATSRVVRVTVEYSVAGEEKSATKTIGRLPFYFAIDTGDAQEKWLKNYDQKFNLGQIQMKAIRLRTLSSGEERTDDSLPAAACEEKFGRAFPHPADMNDRKIVKMIEIDPMQTSGFFPQSHNRRDDPAAMAALLQKLQAAKGPELWTTIEDLGAHPAAIEDLLAVLPKADGDVLLHLCKALAQIGDVRAGPPLLRLWADAPQHAPGSRYIPDVLAAIGDRQVVPALIKPLGELRFDYRFHVIRALGILGGPEAQATLRELAGNDPFPANRTLAREMLNGPAARQPTK